MFFITRAKKRSAGVAGALSAIERVPRPWGRPKAVGDQAFRKGQGSSGGGAWAVAEREGGENEEGRGEGTAFRGRVEGK